MPPNEDKKDLKDDNTPEPKTYTEEAFNNVLGDNKKFKAQRNKAQAELDALKAKTADDERASLEAKAEYKDLYEAERLRNQELKSSITEKDTKFTEASKRSAVNDALGGFKKPEYMKFIDSSKIIMDDNGNIDGSTVENEVIRLKQEFPELIKGSKSSRLPNDAPSSGSIKQKLVSEMTPAERNEARAKLIASRLAQ